MPLPQVTAGHGVSDVLKGMNDKDELSPSLERSLSSAEIGITSAGFGGGEYYPPCKSTVQILSCIYRAVPVNLDLIERIRFSLIWRKMLFILARDQF